jgi:hypothetical protein
MNARLADEDATDEERRAAQISVYTASGAARKREEDEANA